MSRRNAAVKKGKKRVHTPEMGEETEKEQQRGVGGGGPGGGRDVPQDRPGDQDPSDKVQQG